MWCIMIPFIQIQDPKTESKQKQFLQIKLSKPEIIPYQTNLIRLIFRLNYLLNQAKKQED